MIGREAEKAFSKGFKEVSPREGAVGEKNREDKWYFQPRSL